MKEAHTLASRLNCSVWWRNIYHIEAKRAVSLELDKGGAML